MRIVIIGQEAAQRVLDGVSVVRRLRAAMDEGRAIKVLLRP